MSHKFTALVVMVGAPMFAWGMWAGFAALGLMLVWAVIFDPFPAPRNESPAGPERLG